jgi:hypothetical protein
MEPSVDLILVKPILKGLTCCKNQMVLGFPMIPSGYPSDTHWVSWENTMMDFTKM